MGTKLVQLPNNRGMKSAFFAMKVYKLDDLYLLRTFHTSGRKKKKHVQPKIWLNLMVSCVGRSQQVQNSVASKGSSKQSQPVHTTYSRGIIIGNKIHQLVGETTEFIKYYL